MGEKVVISGREITDEDIRTAIYIVDTFGGFSRRQLAKTVCECLGWVTFIDVPKVDGGIKLLEYLESIGEIVLPPKDGSLKTVWKNIEGIKKKGLVDRYAAPVRIDGEIKQEFWWVNGIDYRYGENSCKSVKVNVVVCEETRTETDCKTGQEVEIIAFYGTERLLTMIQEQKAVQNNIYKISCVSTDLKVR